MTEFVKGVDLIQYLAFNMLVQALEKVLESDFFFSILNPGVNNNLQSVKLRC